MTGVFGESKDEQEPRCPVCGGRLSRIVYGMPPADLTAIGDAVTGGCLCYGDGRDPTHFCRKCGRAFTEKALKGAASGDQ